MNRVISGSIWFERNVPVVELLCFVDPVLVGAGLLQLNWSGPGVSFGSGCTLRPPDRMHVHDIHATNLHALGLGHMDLVYHDKGRPVRPTLNEGTVMKKLFAKR